MQNQKEIIIIDEQKLPFSTCQVYKAIHMFDEYTHWWPKQYRVKKLPEHTKTISFSPAPPVKIHWEKGECLQDKQVQLFYTKGPFRGSGVWSMEETEGGTLLRYTTYLNPINPLFRAVAKTSLFRKRHSQDIQKIMRYLQKHLSNLP